MHWYLTSSDSEGWEKVDYSISAGSGSASGSATTTHTTSGQDASVWAIQYKVVGVCGDARRVIHCRSTLDICPCWAGWGTVHLEGCQRVIEPDLSPLLHNWSTGLRHCSRHCDKGNIEIFNCPNVHSESEEKSYSLGSSNSRVNPVRFLYSWLVVWRLRVKSGWKASPEKNWKFIHPSLEYYQWINQPDTLKKYLARLISVQKLSIHWGKKGRDSTLYVMDFPHIRVTPDQKLIVELV